MSWFTPSIVDAGTPFSYGKTRVGTWENSVQRMSVRWWCMECSGIDWEGKDTLWGASVLLALAADPTMEWTRRWNPVRSFLSLPGQGESLGWVLWLLIPFLSVGTKSINEERELSRGRRKEVRVYLSTIGKRSIDSPSCIMKTPLPLVYFLGFVKGKGSSRLGVYGRRESLAYIIIK